MRRFVMGDIHGEYELLMDVLQKSGFNYGEDLLIQLGDLVDRGPEPFKCILELIKIKNTVFIRGNHDECFMQWRETKQHPLGNHPFNGVFPTLKAWENLILHDRYDVIHKFFKNQVPYHITDDNIMFVHGGFPIDVPLDQVDNNTFYWDRDLVKLTTVGEQFDKNYVVHTPTIYWDITTPMNGCGVWNIDTGCGKGGPLTIMNIDTGEYWQSGPKIQEDEEKIETQEKEGENIHGGISGGEEKEKGITIDGKESSR